MRKLVWILLAVIALQACDNKKNASEDAYNIKVDLEGTDGKWVKLMARVDRAYVTYDSALVEGGGPATLSKGVDGVSTMYLTVEGAEESIRILVDNSKYTISGTLESPVIQTNSKPQKDLNAYLKIQGPISEEISAIRAELRKGPDAEDPEAYERLRESYYALGEKQEDLDSAYIAGNPASFATVLALRNMFYMLDVEELEAALNRLDSPLQEMEEYKYMHGRMERLKTVAIGRKYTDFGLETPDGALLRVSDVHQGKVLMIDFWASWCGPCRRANPEVVEIYNTYHDKGFEILGVSLDSDSASWVKAIADDQLTWNHISDLQYWNSAAAELYGVTAIPHTVLIDRDGTIAARNLDGDALRRAIEDLL